MSKRPQNYCFFLSLARKSDISPYKMSQISVNGYSSSRSTLIRSFAQRKNRAFSLQSTIFICTFRKKIVTLRENSRKNLKNEPKQAIIA